MTKASDLTVGDTAYWDEKWQVVAAIKRGTKYAVKHYSEVTGHDGLTMTVPVFDFDKPLPADAVEVYWVFDFIPGFHGVQALDHVSYIANDTELPTK